MGTQKHIIYRLLNCTGYMHAYAHTYTRQQLQIQHAQKIIINYIDKSNDFMI